MSSLLPQLPTRHPLTPFDLSLGLAAIHLIILSLVPPPTPTIKHLRAGIVAPLAISVFIYGILAVELKDYEETWGTALLLMFFSIRTLELLVFWPAEENVYRVRPAKRTSFSSKGKNLTGNGSAKQSEEAEDLVREPIPRPWTRAKFYWACSLWWSWRGLGWNYAAPLPPSSLRHPYTPTSSRRAFLLDRLRFYLLWMLVLDLVRSYMNCSSASPFFSGRAQPYADLTQWQRGVYGTCVALRIVFGMEKSYVIWTSAFVLVGGIMGWEGECWEPWGNAPLYGGLSDIWRNPGLSVMWSRTWHQYFRRWLFLFGWVGLGENVLRLRHTGQTAKERPHLVPASSSSTSKDGMTPSASGRTSPAHPLPTKPRTHPKPALTLLSNLLKSLLVFALTGWIHDQSCLLLLYHHASHSTPQGTVHWRDAIVTTPFFLLQPFGIALESTVKRRWRSWKATAHPEWRKGAEPAWTVFGERLVGFVWTWVWLGWTGGYFVEGLVKIGMYRRDPGELTYPSLFGWLLWGVSRH